VARGLCWVHGERKDPVSGDASSANMAVAAQSLRLGSSGGKASRFNATPFPDAHLVSQFDGGGPLAIPARSPSCVGVTSQSSALDLHGHYDDLHRRDLTLPFRMETGLANVLRKEAVAELITQES
jgi:hypothetical protein